MQGYTFTCVKAKCSKAGWKQMGVTIQHILWTGRPMCDMCGTKMRFSGEDESRYTVTHMSIKVGDRVHIDTDNNEWGRVACDGEVILIHPHDLLIQADEIRAAILVPLSDIIPQPNKGVSHEPTTEETTEMGRDHRDR